jgi:adenosylcobinamide kinase/adenosylcobinamide-phosphate guanylyltransferase
MKQMSHLIYISGGCRSGKSHYAQQLAEGLPGQRAYIATCPQIDHEMADRIERHQQQRAGRGWHTIEAPVNLGKAIEEAEEFDVLLIDCLTLWINNLLYAAEQCGDSLNEHDIQNKCLKLIATCHQQSQTIIFVSNELGMGLVPMDATSRRYRDCLGRCNQTIAQSCDEAVFMVSGLPLILREKYPA